MTLTSVTGPGFYAGVPDELYHAAMINAGGTPVRTWARSDLKKLTREGTPAALAASQVPVDEGGARDDKRKPELEIGKGVHRFVLGVGPDVRHIKADNWLSPRVRDARDELAAAGLLPLNTPEYSKARAVADAVLAHPEAAALLATGAAEISAYTVDEPTGLWIRCRPDWMTDTELVDYKTAESAAPSRFAKSAWEYGYYLQDPFYTDICRALDHPAERFRFIVQEKTPPYLVAVYELDEDSVDLGRQHYREALDRLAWCVAADRWPGYPDTTQPLRLPSWAFPRTTRDLIGAEAGGAEPDTTGLLDDLERILRS